ncbi:MAG TPA: hypothetical protein VF717_16955 [Pyrinomonadaceae bacterium]|jgi:hypothetical protein
MEPKFHPGNLSLAQLRDQCQAFQNLTPAKLVHLQGASIENPVSGQTKFNQGVYVKIGDLDKVQELKFVQVTDPTKIPTMIGDQLQDKFLFIFDEILFVSNQEQRVLGFGKA